MKAKLVVEGKEFDIEINDTELEKLVKPPKQTGYERLYIGYSYCTVGRNGLTEQLTEMNDDIDTMIYDAANYYSDKTVAENNARADRLMRQLRRFAVEHREKSLDWRADAPAKWSIAYNHEHNDFFYGRTHWSQEFGVIYFDSDRACELAVEAFHDELIWYFTEYKDSL